MNKQLEIETELRKKIKEIGKKSAARKTALKQLEKAYKISQQALELAVQQNLRHIQKIRQLEKEKLPWWKR